MVKDFNEVGMFKNRWMDFSLRQSVYDGRCYRMANEDPPPADPEGFYGHIPQLQKKQWIEGLSFVEYPDGSPSELQVNMRWQVVRDANKASYENNICQQMLKDPKGGINACYISDAPYTGAVVYLWRIDGSTSTPFSWSTTKVTKIGFFQRAFITKVSDDGTTISADGGSQFTLTSNLKWKADINNSGEPWKSLEFDTGFQGPEKANNRLQTNTYYYFTLEPRSYLAQINDKKQTMLRDEFVPISLTSEPSLKSPSDSIINSRALGLSYYQFTDRQDRNDYFPWFLTPATFEGKKTTTPSLRWGNWLDIGLQSSTTSPDTLGGVTGAQTGGPTKFDIELKGTFFYNTLDFDSQNNLRLPLDLPTYVGFSTKNLSVPGSNFVEVYSIYVGGLQYTKYVHNLPTALGGVDTDRHFDFTYTFEAAANTQWQYRIWVKKENGNIFYTNLGTSKNFPYFSSLTPSDLPITTGKFTVTNWVNPSSKNSGFWYQMLRCWNNDTTSTTRLSPFMTVLKKAIGGAVAVPGINTSVDGDYPIFHYLNYTFEADKNYQFRTILENFYTLRSAVTSAKLANLNIITPWGEKMEMNPPYINFDTVPSSMRRINMYLNTNINSYSTINNDKIKDTNGNVPTKPIPIISSKSNPQNPITYTAKPYFGGDIQLAGQTSLISGLNWVGVLRFDWIMQGSATFNIMSQTTNGAVVAKETEKIPLFISDEPFGGRGWHYLSDQKKLVWFDKIGNPQNLTGLLTELNDNFPIGADPGDYFANKTSDVKYLNNNFVATYVPYQSFNVSFDYVNESPFGISMYLGGDLPFAKDDTDFWQTDIDDLITKGLVKFIGKLGASNGVPQNCEFIGLVGNQYLFFVADTVIQFGRSGAVSQGLFKSVTIPNNKTNYIFDNIPTGYPINTNKNDTGFLTYSVISLYNFTFAGAYNDGNNKVYLTGTNTSAQLTNATYSIKLGTGNNVFPDSANTTITTNSKAGNGSFTRGTWENGVWNSGWREDLTVSEFNTVENSFFYNRARIWRISIGGRLSSVTKFVAGDVVSISNIVAIDINDNRKLLNKSYIVLSVDETTITVETDTNFPIKRIEKDSEEHRILVSKNIWLSGVFLNGYFSGIWNNGLFSGFPFITKMDQAHWIDGIFNGGQFVAEKVKSYFNSVKNYIQDGTPRLALNFLGPHGMEPNDTISITYSNNFSSIESLGTTTIISTPDPLTVVTGIVYDKKYNAINTGTVNSTISTGLIQNFRFYSNNASNVTSLNTMRSERVFSYNSWIDVNYSNKSAVNIGRPQTFIDNISERAYSENNLYGYPTNDVLSSDSVFRDSFSLSSRRYRLGRKYRILNDFVGSPSAFEQDFGPTDTLDGNETFEAQGWEMNEATAFEVQRISAISGIDKLGYLHLTFHPNNKNIQKLEVGDNITVNGWAYYLEFRFFPNIPPVPIRSQSYTMSVDCQVSEITTINGFIDIKTTSNMFTYPNDGDNWDIDSTFSINFSLKSSVVISRTPEPLTSNTTLVGKEMKIVADGSGGVVNLIPVEEMDNRTNGRKLETLGKLRYTMVDFEMVDFKTTAASSIYEGEGLQAPPINFKNLNYVTRLGRDMTGNKILMTLAASYLPVYRNVNHVVTPGRKKQEFFFNKRNLLMRITGSGYMGTDTNEFYLDNLKFYEVDMIPFFQYFRSPIGMSGNINISVQIPNTGTSPTIQPTEDFVDATAGNDVVNEFAEKFIASNVQVPKSVNWRADYAIYRTQQQDLTGNPGLYGEN